MKLGVGLTALTAAMLLGTAVQADITDARYGAPTTRYPHAILGDGVEYGALILTRDTAPNFTITLPESRVFEDTAPRLADVDGDGMTEVVVVESDQSRGARLAVYDDTGLRMATPFIGTRFRWLAPVAIADLDNDGHVEIAYIDRPHLAKKLRVWRVVDDDLVLVTEQDGLTNHKIGESDIAGGLRDCGNGPEMILADANWRRLIAVNLANDTLTSKDIGVHRDRGSFAAALACKN